MTFETEFVAGGKDTYAVIADMAGNDYGITFSYVARQECVIALVSPVTIYTPAVRAALAISETISFKSESGRPSSKIKLAER